MTRVDLDALQKILGEPLFMDGAPVVALDVDAARFLVAELRAAREVVDALHAWESMDGMYFGHTPQEGGDVGRALIAYDEAVGS